MSGHVPGTREYRRLLVGLAAAGVATFAQLYSPQGLLPTLADGLGVSASDAALSVSVATMGVAVAVLGWSWAADRYGRLVGMRAAIVASAVLGILVPFSPNLPVLLGFRFLEGCALAGLPALAITYLNDEVDRAHAAGAAAVYISGTTVGGMVGRLIAGALAGPLGWRGALSAVAMVCALAALVFVRVAPVARGYRPMPATWRTVATGVRANLADSGMLALYAQPVLLMGSFVAVYNYLGFRLEGNEFGMSAAAASLLFLAYGAGTVSSRLSGGWIQRYGRRRVLATSHLTMLVGLLVTISGSLVGVLVGLLVFTAGFFAAHTTASSWAGARAVTGHAQATSLYNVANYTGSALIGWLIGYVWVSAAWAGVVAAVGVLTCGALAILVADGLRDRVGLASPVEG